MNTTNTISSVAAGRKRRRGAGLFRRWCGMIEWIKCLGCGGKGTMVGYRGQVQRALPWNLRGLRLPRDRLTP